jgi:hypothetical protein
MSGWTDRILAALGLGGRKPEADVSYDPAEVDRSTCRAPQSAAPDQGTPVQAPSQQFAGLPESDPDGRDEATGPTREPGGP